MMKMAMIKKTSHTFSFKQQDIYIQTGLHKNLIYTTVFTHNTVTTSLMSRAQNIFDTHFFNKQKSLHTKAAEHIFSNDSYFTQRPFYTQASFTHTNFRRRCLHTQNFLRAWTFTVSNKWASYFTCRFEPRMWQSQHLHLSFHTEKNKYCRCWHVGGLTCSNFTPRLNSSCLRFLSLSLQTCQPSTASHRSDRPFCSIGGFSNYLPVISLHVWRVFLIHFVIWTHGPSKVVVSEVTIPHALISACQARSPPSLQWYSLVT